MTYPDWPQVDFKEAEGGKKRKRADASNKLTSMSKRGGCGHGHAVGPKVDRVIAAKVPASSVGSPVVTARPGSTISLVLWPSAVGGSLPSRKMPSISSLPILQKNLDDDDDEEDEEKEGS